MKIKDRFEYELTARLDSPDKDLVLRISTGTHWNASTAEFGLTPQTAARLNALLERYIAFARDLEAE